MCKYCRSNNFIINKRAEATSLIKAAAKHGIVPDIVFIRSDGWALGAPERLSTVAFETWRAEWTHFAQRPDWIIKSIVEYYQ